ncbi:MAG: protein kinase, partial [Candidatus Saccharimonas sp.]|nr:protein kinase [Planctomycetaceae bacterium]
MTLKLTAASFLAGVKQSGLIEPERVDSLLSELLDGGIDCNDSVAIATALVDRQALTEWQSEKLLQGRHKGFLLGRYRLLSLLGAGEMSAVYLAEHIMMERRCAIKVLPANKVQDTSYLGRFHREARAVAAMNHLNIVRAYDVDKQTESGTEIHFLVMEYVEGRNLEQIVKDRGPLDYVTAVDTIRQAADGL